MSSSRLTLAITPNCRLLAVTGSDAPELDEHLAQRLADANLSELFELEMAAERPADERARVADRKRPPRRAKASKKVTKGKPGRKATSARKKLARSARASTKRKAALRAKRGTT